MKFEKEKTPYRIITKNLLLRCLDPKDTEMMGDAVNSSLDILLPWTIWAQHEPNDRETRTFYLRKNRGNFDLDKEYVYGIFNKDESKLLGSCGYTALNNSKSGVEIHTWVRKDHNNQGIAAESARALIKTAFELTDIDRVELSAAANNHKSLGAIKKLKIKEEATLKRRQKDTNDNYLDMKIFSIFKFEYENSEMKNFKIDFFDVCDEKI